MTVIARRIISDPIRLATATWTTIVDLLAPEEDNSARAELLSITGVASSLISSEVMKDSAIIAYGSGPRVRIYCLYGEEAITGENANETALVSSPIKGGGWGLSLPCPESELEWVQATLKKKSSRISARDMNTTFDVDSDEESTSSKSGSIDMEEFSRL
jgi:hypothetical protein